MSKTVQMKGDFSSPRVSLSDDIQVAKSMTEKDRSTVMFASIVESSDDAIMSVDLKGVITSWNKGAERLYGYTADEVLGKPVSLLMPTNKKDDFSKLIRELKEEKRVEHYETQRQTKDGRVIDVSISVSPMRDETGRVIGASKIARDITQRKRTENSLQILSEASKNSFIIAAPATIHQFFDCIPLINHQIPTLKSKIAGVVWITWRLSKKTPRRDRGYCCRVGS